MKGAKSNNSSQKKAAGSRQVDDTNGESDDCEEIQVEARHSTTSLFSLSKYSRAGAAVSRRRTMTTATNAAVKQECKSKQTAAGSSRKQQRAIPIPSFVGFDVAMQRDSGVDILAKVDRALRLDADNHRHHHHHGGKQKNVKGKPLKDSKVVAAVTKKCSPIPIPKFFCLDNDDKDDDKDDDDGLLTMPPVFRKQQLQLQAAIPSMENVATSVTAQATEVQGADNHNRSASTANGPGPKLVATNNVDADISASAMSLNDLLAATDTIYNCSDPETTTIKSILTALELNVGVTLNRSQRKQIKEHVMNHHLGGDGNGRSKKKKTTKQPTVSIEENQKPSAMDDEEQAREPEEDHSVQQWSNGDSQPDSSMALPPNIVPPQPTSATTGVPRDSSQGISPPPQQQQQQQQQPSVEALQSATECLYSFSDPNTTMQEAWDAMESFLGVTLSKDSQQIVEKQWSKLAGRVNPPPSTTIVGAQNLAVDQMPPPLSAKNGSVPPLSSSVSSTKKDAVEMQDANAPNKVKACQRNVKVYTSANKKERRRLMTTVSSKSHAGVCQRGPVLPAILEEAPTHITTNEYVTGKATENFSPLGGSAALCQDASKYATTIPSASTARSSSNLMDVTNCHAGSNMSSHPAVAVARVQETTTNVATVTTMYDAKTSNNNVRKRRLRKADTSVEVNQSIGLPNNAHTMDAPVTKNNRKRPRKDSCALCSTCPCASNDGNEATSVMDLSRSEAEMERALLRRMAKLERTTEGYEQQKEAVKRELKKLRRKLLKRQAAKLGLEKAKPFGDSYFLPDAEAWDETFQDISTASLPPSTVSKAKEKLYPPGGQPTLTQMLGRKEDPEQMCEAESGGVGNDGSDTENHLEHEDDEDFEVGGTYETGAVDCEAIDHEDDAQVDDDIHRISWKCGSNSPVASPSVMHRTGIWHAATLATSNPNPCHPDRYATSWDGIFADFDTDDGIDELVDMFDDAIPTTPEKTTSADLPSSDLVDKSCLSQPSRHMVEVVEDMIQGHPEKQLAVARLCGNWRENIVFAFTRDEAEVCDALDNVKQSKERLKRNMAKILEACQRREALLELYEQSLEKARERLQAKARTVEDSDMLGNGIASPRKAAADDDFEMGEANVSPQKHLMSENIPRTPNSCRSTASNCRLQYSRERLATILETESILSASQ